MSCNMPGKPSCSYFQVGNASLRNEDDADKDNKPYHKIVQPMKNKI